MALTFVRSGSAKDETGTSVTPAVVLASAPAAGDLLTWECTANIQGGDVTLTPPSGFVVPTNGDIVNAGQERTQVAWKIADGTEGTTLLGAMSGSGTAWSAAVKQFHDSAGGGWVFDKSAKNTGSSTTATTGTTAATAVADEVAIAVVGVAKQATLATPTNSFTLDETQVASAGAGNFTSLGSLHRILTATGTISTGLTLGTSRPWTAAVFTFYAVIPPANTVAPVASGTATVGQTLSTTTGTWTGSSPSFTYQWQRDNFNGGVYADIPGATASSYVLVDADDGCKVRCRVTGTNLGGQATASSNALGPVVEPAPVNLVAPVVAGSAIDELTVSDGAWSGMSGHTHTFAYQWQRSANGTTGWANIGGATSSSYTMTGADLNQYLRVVVTADNSASGTVAANSNVKQWLGAVVGLVVEMAFGFGPGDASPTWTDVTDYVRGIPGWDRGRQNELNQMQAGTGHMVVRDFNSDFDPRNPDGAFYPNVRPGTPVRAYITMGFETFPLFRMTTERQPRTLRVTDKYTERQIDMVDGFAILANAGISGFSYPQQSSDARFSDVLDDVGWSASARQLGAGASTLQPVAYPGDADEKAQTHLLAVNDSENGLFFCDGNGDVVLVGRHELIQIAGYTTSKATFRDAGGSSGYVYHDLSPSFDLDNVVNRYIGTRDGGAPQIAEDFVSQDRYFQREKQQGSLVATDAEVLNQMQWKVGQFAEPLDRVDQIVVQPFREPSNLAAVQAMIDREVGDRITVLETPAGFALEQSDEYTIQHLSGSIPVGTPKSGPHALAAMTLTFLLWPAATVSFWVAGDSVLSRAGVTTKPGY